MYCILCIVCLCVLVCANMLAICALYTSVKTVNDINSIMVHGVGTPQTLLNRHNAYLFAVL